MSVKLDTEIHNGLVSIVFTSLFPYMAIVTLTFDLWPPKSIGIILSSWLTCLPSLTKKHATVQSLSCSQGPWTDARTDAHTEPQQRYYIPTATRCAGIINVCNMYKKMKYTIQDMGKLSKDIYKIFSDFSRNHHILTFPTLFSFFPQRQSCCIY